MSIFSQILILIILLSSSNVFVRTWSRWKQQRGDFSDEKGHRKGEQEFDALPWSDFHDII